MYAKIKSGAVVVYPYTYAELQKDNPHTNFNGADLLTIFPHTESGADAELVPVTTQPAPSFNARTQKVVYDQMPTYTNGAWVLACSVVSLNAEELAQKSHEEAESVRADRNRRLTESDWSQLPDAPVDQAAWAAYRQMLRDIPTQPGFPFDVNWPIQPE